MADDPDRNLNRFIIRFTDPKMRDRLKGEAANNRRTLNAEIEARLEASLSQKPADFTGHIDMHTNGRPVSWDEIQGMMAVLNRMAGERPLTLTMSVFTPEVLSSDCYEDAAEDLRRSYLEWKKANSKQIEATKPKR